MLERRRAFPRERLATLVVLALAATPVDASALSYVYVQEGSPLTYRPGSSEPDPGWADPGYLPGTDWTDSATGFGIGYGDGDDRTTLDDMRDGYLTVYARATFDAGDEVAALAHLELTARFDDGFVAYLNGVEVARSHMPAGVPFHDLAASAHEAADGDEVFSIDASLLVAGENVFAVEVHNASLGSSDLSFVPTLWGYDEPPVDAEIVMGPILQQLGRRRALVCWETDAPAPSRVAYGRAGEGFEHVAEEPEERTRHEVWLEGLSPATEYAYRVESAMWPSPDGSLRTERDRADPYRIVVYGDTRSNHDDHRMVVERIVTEVPDVALHTGDLVGTGSSQSNWEIFFDVEAELLRDVPLYSAIGNHEGDGLLYVDHFALPDDTPNPELYYAFRYSTSAFVVIDLYESNYDPGSTQYEWIRSTLEAFAADRSVRHIFVAFHHGPYDSGPHGSHSGVRTHLVPLFIEHGVSMVFSGHDHTYERSTMDGVVYVVTGGGGAPLYSADGDYWTEVTEAVLHYCVLDIDGPIVHFQARRLDGSLLDEINLGGDPEECLAAADCESTTHSGCEADEEGAWFCLHGACVWSCTLQEEASPPPPDGGPDGGPRPDAGPIPDGGARPDGGPLPQPDGGTGDGGPDLPSGAVGGCACGAVGTAEALPFGLLSLLALAALARRRR